MSESTTSRTPSDGPYFEDLRVGEVVATAPALTLTSGHAALHQAIVGDRLRLPLDATLSARVVGSAAPLAHPGLVCDVAIGQSTVVTQRVIANLFYRGLVLRRFPVIGDTLSTTVEAVALRQTSSRPDRPATGLAALRVRTVDQEFRPVLDFWRCAMLPLRDSQGQTDLADDLDAIGEEIDPGALDDAVRDWRLDTFREAVPGPHFDDVPEGAAWKLDDHGDVVSAAPELARLTLNVAAAHHDHDASGRGQRLVYGGHTIGIAAAQVTRVLPALVAIVAWHSCEHIGPVFEGDTLHTEVEVDRRRPSRRATRREHRGGPLLDRTRPARGPPRARQPPMHTLRPRGRTGVPQPSRELRSSAQTNPDSCCVRCNMKPPCPP